MSRRFVHEIVVDASVARAAGSNRAVDPLSIGCRDSLSLMKNKNVAVVMSKDLWEEWKNHMSGYSSTWLSVMKGRKLFKKVNPPETDDKLLKAVDCYLDSNGDKQAIRKDLHLVDAAFASDRRVLSLDDSARGRLCDLCRYVKDLTDIHWTNPKNDDCHPWLEAGAPDEPGLTLCAEPR